MTTLQQRLLYGLAGFVGFAIFAAGLTSAVGYRPWGVPIARLDEYEAKIRQIRQHNEKVERLSRIPAAKLATSKRDHDFGLVDHHSSLFHEFRIENRGDATLELAIDPITTPSLTATLKHSTVPPGGSSAILIEWNPNSSAMLDGCEFTLQSNDPFQSRVTFAVRAAPKKRLLAPDEVELGLASVGETTWVEFAVYSQTSTELSLTSIEDKPEDLEWFSKPIEVGDPAPEGTKSALKVKFQYTPFHNGAYEMPVVARFEVDGQRVERTVRLTGKTRSPIQFVHPEMFKGKGLDVGTLSAGSDHPFHIIVRQRQELHRELTVLDVKPDALLATMKPIKSTPGAYRLTVVVPGDRGTLIFNRDDQRGYVKVGDPSDDRFFHWFPFYGAVAADSP